MWDINQLMKDQHRSILAHFGNTILTILSSHFDNYAKKFQELIIVRFN